MQVFADLIRVVQKAQAELVLDIEEKQRKTESWAIGQMQELEQEIDVLKLRNIELAYLSHTEDHIHFLQVEHLKYSCIMLNTGLKCFAINNVQGTDVCLQDHNWHCTNITKLASSNLCALQKLAFCK